MLLPEGTGSRGKLVRGHGERTSRTTHAASKTKSVGGEDVMKPRCGVSERAESLLTNCPCRKNAKRLENVCFTFGLVQYLFLRRTLPDKCTYSRLFGHGLHSSIARTEQDIEGCRIQPYCDISSKFTKSAGPDRWPRPHLAHRMNAFLGTSLARYTERARNNGHLLLYLYVCLHGTIDHSRNLCYSSPP